jgi:uncharacterized Zn finger protein (UPF0148 family)
MKQRKCPNCKWSGIESDTKTGQFFCPVCGDNTESFGEDIVLVKVQDMDLNGDGIEDAKDVKKAAKVLKTLGTKMRGRPKGGKK